MRRMDIILAIGRDDPLRGENEEFSRPALGERHLACAADLGRLVARLALLAADDSGVRVRGGLRYCDVILMQSAASDEDTGAVVHAYTCKAGPLGAIAPSG